MAISTTTRSRSDLKTDQPLRLRSERYLKFIRSKPCLHCGAPADAHHLTFVQPKARGLKAGDQWTVPLCRRHHDQLHTGGLPERTFWATLGIDPITWAERTYTQWLKENLHGDDHL